MANVDSGYLIDNRVYSSLKKLYGNDTWFWGESATPLFVMMSKLAQKSGDSSLSNRIICDLIIDIAFKNAFKEEESLPDPYYSVKQLINHNYGSPEEKIDLGSFSGQSYHLAVLVDILVRKDRRDLLSEVWKRISYIANLEFMPSSLADIFKWHCSEGEELNTFYSNPQSWSELRKK